MALFLVLEYARPPGVAQYKIQMLLIIVIPALCLLKMKKRPWATILSLQLALVVINTLHVPLAINTYAAYFTLRILAGTVAIAISIAWLYSNLSSFRKGMWVWSFVMLYAAVHGIKYAGKGPGGFIGDENDLALACNTALPLAFFGFQLRRGLERWVYGGLAVVLGAAVVATLSRGGAVGLGALGVYCLAVSKHKTRNFMLTIIAGIALIGLAPQEYREELVSIKAEASGEVRGTGKSRMFLWTSAFRMWLDYPIFGVGAGSVGYSIGDYQPTDWESYYNRRNWSGTTVHSFYFQVLPEQGLVGTIIVGAIAVSLFTTMSRLRRRARAQANMPSDLRADVEIYTGALSGAMVGFLASGAFLSVAYYPYFWYFTALGVALDSAVKNELFKLRGSQLMAKGERARARHAPSSQTNAADGRGAMATNPPPAGLGAGLRPSQRRAPSPWDPGSRTDGA